MLGRERAGMQLDWAAAIDTACTGCGSNAVDWVQMRDGTRRYACEDCLGELLRYDAADSLHDLPDTPNAVLCQACERFTLEMDTGPAGVRCPDCAPEDTEAVLEAARKAVAGDNPHIPDEYTEGVQE